MESPNYQLIYEFPQIVTEVAWKVPITNHAAPITWAQLLFIRSVFSATKTKSERNFAGQKIDRILWYLSLDVRFEIEVENQSKL